MFCDGTAILKLFHSQVCLDIKSKKKYFYLVPYAKKIVFESNTRTHDVFYNHHLYGLFQFLFLDQDPRFYLILENPFSVEYVAVNRKPNISWCMKCMLH